MKENCAMMDKMGRGTDESKIMERYTMKKFLKVILIIALAVIILLIAIYINHQIRLKQESKLRSPLGQIVEVDGHNMSIYIEGAGDATLVFMSGGGTCSPILDFKSLYALLSDKYSSQTYVPASRPVITILPLLEV